MQIYKANYTIITGFIGISIILYGIISSYTEYIGCSGQQYNFLNHFVSELGQYECSPKANTFNISLIFGTLFLIIYYFNIIPESSKKIKILFRWIISIIGCSAISIAIFSMDNIFIHVISALVFFYVCFFASLLFNIYSLFMSHKYVPKYFIISGILISVTTLLNIIQFHQLEFNMLNTLKNRPDILFICIIEWTSLLSMLLFFISSIIFFIRR